MIFHGESESEEHFGIWLFFSGHIRYFRLKNPTIFQKMYEALKVDGVLVTYAAKGSVRRAMQAVGFKVEKLPGPPGKREMLRATKPSTTQN